MEPKLPAPNLSPERTPNTPSQNIEAFPMPPSPETGFERGEKSIERQGEASPASVVAPTPVLPTPVISSVPQPSVPQATQHDIGASPAVANDDDLIEKEWVDKAKQIISQTRDDPHKREQQVGALQRDYLKKRYGKELGDS